MTNFLFTYKIVNRQNRLITVKKGDGPIFYEILRHLTFGENLKDDNYGNWRIFKKEQE